VSLCCREVRGISLANVVVFSWIKLFCDEENDEVVVFGGSGGGGISFGQGFLKSRFWWQRLGWCIIGTGLCDGVASLWPSKEHVPADGTRFEHGFPHGAADGTFGRIKHSEVSIIVNTSPI